MRAGRRAWQQQPRRPCRRERKFEHRRLDRRRVRASRRSGFWIRFGLRLGIGSGPTTITLDQSTSDNFSEGIGCNDNGTTYKNEFYRVFDLAAAGITTTFTVTKATFGVYYYDGAGDIQVTATVGTYTGTAGGATLTGTFSPVGSPTTANVPTTNVGDNNTVDVAMSQQIPGSSQLYVEIQATAGDDDAFALGANTGTESAPGYVQNSTSECGQSKPSDITTANGTQTTLIIRVTGTY